MPSPLLHLRTQYMTLADATSRALQQAILSGKFAPGSQLPPEFDLMAQLGVSRTTLREALKRLEEQGLIIRRRGRGTYVRERSIVKDLSLNFGISEMITQAGFTPGVRSAALRHEPAPPEVALALAIPEGAPLVVIERVRTADERPVVWSRDMLPAAELEPRRLTTEDLATRSLYASLSDLFHIRVARGVAQLTPIIASAELAAPLAVRRGTPLLRMAQTDFDVNDQPVLYSVEYHLPDAFVFLVNRKGPHW
jgi:GntR family transcriptional regulator